MTLRQTAPAVALLVLATGCGGGGDRTSGTTTTTTASAPAITATPAPTDAKILGEDTAFAATDGAAGDLQATVDGRECGLTETLFGSCRASTGTGGRFLVTAEGNPDAPTEWNVVVRCGLDPSVPIASARGTFQPQTADLGLATVGEVLGITLTTDDQAEAVLVYQPAGSDCPTVWGLGPIAPSTLLLGGTDSLNGTERPIQFTQVDGSTACAVADGHGGVAVAPASGDVCAG